MGCALVTSIVLVGLAGCGGEDAGSLSGAWSRQDSAGYTLTLVFGEGGRALWIADRIPGVQDTTMLSYRIDATATPFQLDIMGFTDGPLAGMTLYGIYERTGGDSLRLDFEPGLPGQRAVRPDSFTAEAMTFTRQ